LDAPLPLFLFEQESQRWAQQSGWIIGHGWIWITKWGLPKEQSLLAFDQEDSDKDMLTNNTAGQKMMTNSSSRTPVDLIYIDSKNIWTYFICVGFSLYRLEPVLFKNYAVAWNMI
jgi:hypothetical protein